MKEKQYVAEIPVKGHVFFIEKKSFVDEHSPYFRKEISVAIGKAIEKILENNSLEVYQIDSIDYKQLTCEYAGRKVLEVKIFDIEIKTKEGDLYSLKEYTYPEV